MFQYTSKGLGTSLNAYLEMTTMAKLTWNNLNRFQRSFVTKSHTAFVEIENDAKLNEEQKDVQFLEHYNNLVKADYSNFKFPTSIPTSGLGIAKAPRVKAKAAPKKAKAKKKDVKAAKK